MALLTVHKIVGFIDEFNLSRQNTTVANVSLRKAQNTLHDPREPPEDCFILTVETLRIGRKNWK